MNRFTILLALLFYGFISPVSSQESTLGETDLSRSKEALGDLIPTKQEVETLWSELKQLNQPDDCENIVEKADSAAGRFNRYAAVLRRGLEPYYDADRDQRKEFMGSATRSLVKDLGDFENLSNSYIQHRNEAWVMQAECLASLDDPLQAAILFFHALDHIDIEDRDLWHRAREGLWKLAGAK